MKIPCKITLTGDENYARNFIGAAQSQMRILENQMSFQNLKQGVRRVRFNSRAIMEAIICFNLKEVKIHCLPAIIKGIEEGGFEKLPKLYIYVTISDYVTIWDLLTGEVAEDICDNEGKIYDDNNDPLITFPCHKSELVTWLSGIKDKPTRQVLKDEPENNRDYLDDNELDIGNEDRVELANIHDPSYECYFGVYSPCSFINIVQDTHVDTDPTWPYTYPRKVYDFLEKDTPHPNYITTYLCDPAGNCTLSDCNRSFSAMVDGNLYNTPNGYYIDTKTNNITYLEPYQPRSKMLYLSLYPSSVYRRPDGVDIEYSLPAQSPYLNPIAMKSSNISFSCLDAYGSDDWGLSTDKRDGDTASFSTVLGDLIVDFIPARDLPDDEKSLYDVLRAVIDNNSMLDEDCFALCSRDGVCRFLSKSEIDGGLWGSSERRPEHATEGLGWCWKETRSTVDIRESESNRFGISWCGSSYNYRSYSESSTDGWYRILLRFYMGGFHTSGRSNMLPGIDEFFCPNQSDCDAHPEWGCDLTIWADELRERFSSVQPTIELEKPEEYPKKINTAKYERPNNYNANPDGTGFCINKKYSTLCAFPGREWGTEEDTENDTCYPFDGTYILHTLGEAVEELMNGHYVDGSDDQLLVYLYERPNMIEEGVEK